MAKQRSLREFLDRLAASAFGMTRSEAHDLGVCIQCRRPPKPQTRDDAAEYQASALCSRCYDVLANNAEALERRMDKDGK